MVLKVTRELLLSNFPVTLNYQKKTGEPSPSDGRLHHGMSDQLNRTNPAADPIILDGLRAERHHCINESMPNRRFSGDATHQLKPSSCRSSDETLQQ